MLPFLFFFLSDLKQFNKVSLRHVESILAFLNYKKVTSDLAAKVGSM